MLRRIADLVRVRPGEVYHLPPSATVLDAARMMKTKACGAVIVMKQGTSKASSLSATSSTASWRLSSIRVERRWQRS
jgi:hypothetical protein